MNKLYNGLYDHNISKNNLNELLESFEKDKFIPFIGAGLSKPLGIGDWEELLERLRNIVKDKFSINIECIKDSKQWPQQLASDIYNIFKQNKSEELFYDELVNGLEPTNCKWDSIHCKLYRTFNIILTTNFDASIELAFKYNENRDPNIQFIPYLNALQLKKESIIYLHGNKNLRLFIFKKEEYDKYYPSVSKNQNKSTVLEDFLKQLYREKSFIFFGFSFRDYYLEEYFKYLAFEFKNEELINEQFCKSSKEGYKEKKYKHFLVLNERNLDIDIQKSQNRENEGNLDIDIQKIKNREIEQRCGYFESINIKPIIYQRDYHIFIEDLLEHLIVDKDIEEPEFL